MQIIMANISDVLVYCLLLFLWFVFTSLFRYIVKQRSAPKEPIQHPPSPPSLPIIGHIHLLGSILSKSFQTLSKQYGPIMRLKIGSSTAIIVSSSDIAREILKNNEMNFVSRPDFGAADYNIYSGSKFVNADYGTYWRFMKKICMTELLSMQQVHRYIDIRREETKKLLEILVNCSKMGRHCDLGVELVKMTNNVICRMAMSTRCSGSADESKEVWEFVKGVLQLAPNFSLGESLGPLGKLDLFGHGRKLKSLFKKFDSLVESILEEHEKSRGKKERKDMMDILLEIYRDEDAEVKLTRIDMKSFLMEIFMAGTETVSVALQWTVAELINHPKVFMKLREEIDQVVGPKRLVEESDVPNLPYLQAVIRESLRLHAPAPLMFRKCGEDCKINGYDILSNERVIFNLYAIMRDPSSWENPLSFLPERFMVEESKENHDHYQMDIKGQNFNIFPFGSGRRGCPGASLTMAVVHVTIGMLVQCFDFKVHGGEKINTEEGPGLSAGMANPLLCYPISHANPSQFISDMYSF